MIQPGITLRESRSGLQIDQTRPGVTGLLRGLDVAESLARIPSLLPVCGHAQQIAGQHACIAAGAVIPESADARGLLWREQMLAAGWRLTVDWPELIAESRQLETLRDLRMAEERALADCVRGLLPGLPSADSPGALENWVQEGGCVAARVIRRAREVEPGPSQDSECCRLLSGEALRRCAEDVLDEQPFDPLLPAAEAVEVGALAMARHPLLQDGDRLSEFGCISRRLLAQVLDTLALCEQHVEQVFSASWNVDEVTGLGLATTARGPVFHRVSLEQDDRARIGDWRVIAPTDWHFAERGPLQYLARSTAPEALPFLVTAFDPCAPWTVAPEGIQRA